MTKELPPYADSLDNNYQTVLICIGALAWDNAKDLRSHIPYVLVLPPWTSPTRYSWPVQGKEVYIIDSGKTPESFLRFCAVHLFSYGADAIHYVSAHSVINFEKEV